MAPPPNVPAPAFAGSAYASSQEWFKDQICCGISTLLSCSNLHVNVQNYSSGFSGTSFTNTKDVNGYYLPATDTYSPGAACDVVLVQATYTWTVVTPGLTWFLVNMAGNAHLLATTAFRNEPYTSAGGMLRAAMAKRFLALWKDKGGLAAVEFAFVLPVMLTFFLGLIEAGQALGCRADVTNMASIGADLIAQESQVNNADMSNVFSALNEMLYPYDTSKATITVYSIVDNGTSGTGKVAWCNA